MVVEVKDVEEIETTNIIETDTMQIILNKLFPKNFNDLIAVSRISEDDFKAILSLFAVKKFLNNESPTEILSEIDELALRLKLSVKGESRKEILELYKSTSENNDQSNNIIKHLL